MNWKSTVTPMADEMKNPPLACYYLAAAMAVLGRGEAALHLAMLLPAIGVVLGTYQLARELGAAAADATLAAAAVLLSPAFLICGTSVMCDVAMLCAACNPRARASS